MRFRHPGGGTLHLAYCTNVHPAESVDGIIDQLERYAGAVRERLGAESLGVGLWLSHLVVDEPGAAERLREAIGAVLSGRLDPMPLITNTFPLSRLDEALNATRDRPEGFLKAVVRMP